MKLGNKLKQKSSKLALFADGKITSKENSKKFTKILLDLVKNFRKAIGYKMNI